MIIEQISNIKVFVRLQIFFKVFVNPNRDGKPTDLTDNFCQISLIGKGGYGSVYLCTNTDTGRNFVMKQVDVCLDADNNNSARKELKALKNEIDILKRLDHPNIATYFRTYILNSNFSIAMEYIEGESR